MSVLATSREPLGIAGECVWAVEPLALPIAEDLDVAHVVESPAVQLFVDRAVSALPSFELTDANAGAVAEICRRLDGLPLALELAAPRLRMMGPEVLAERLDQRFALLTEDRRAVDARHRTLRAVVDWSHDLLAPEEQALFARLSTFAAGFDLRAAECGVRGRWHALDRRRRPAGEPRRPVDGAGRRPRRAALPAPRDAAGLRPRAAGRAGASSPSAIARHLAWYVSVAREGALGLTGPDEAYWMARLDRDLANFREAHANALRAGDVSSASALVVALREFAFRRIRYEVTSWAAATVALPGFDQEPQAPIVLGVGAYGGFVRGDLEYAIEWGHQALDLAAQLGTETSGLAERALGNALFYRGDSDEAVEWIEPGGRLCARRRIRRASRARVVHAIGRGTRAPGTRSGARCSRARRARSRYEAIRPPRTRRPRTRSVSRSRPATPKPPTSILRRSAALGAECGNRWIEAFALTEVHSLDARRGDTTAALRGFASVIRTWYRGGDWANQWLSLRHVCGALAMTGATRPAAVLHGALSAAGAAYALPGTPDDTAEFERLGVELREQLGAAEYATAVREGVALRDTELVAFVLDEIERLTDS